MKRKIELSNKQISKIEGLDGLENLEILNLSNNNISKIEGLDGLENLEILNLSNNNISKIEGLDNLPELKRLLMSQNQITKIEGLNGLKNLKMIELDFNNISKIENLEGLKNLNSISLSNTQIKSVTRIDCLSDLYSLDITNTEVSSLEPLKKFKRIGYIRANDCPIRSLHGIDTNSRHLIELAINSENLCPTGAALYKKLFHEYSYPLNQKILGRREGNIDNRNDLPPLLEFYHRSPTELAIQYIGQFQSYSYSLTSQETERLIHEATQKERMILEDAIDKNILFPEDSILSQITARFCVNVKISKGKNKHLKILL